jgi:hypothetical protein
MPTLANRQMEEFCQHLASGHNQSEAARRAGYSAKNANNIACRLVKREDVKARILEVKGYVESDPVKIAGKSWVMSEAVSVHRLSVKDKQYSVAKSCLELIARLQGFLVDKRESDSRQLKINIANPAELREVLRSSYELLPTAEREELNAVDTTGDRVA